jgi:hypothetical protein
MTRFRISNDGAVPQWLTLTNSRYDTTSSLYTQTLQLSAGRISTDATVTWIAVAAGITISAKTYIYSASQRVQISIANTGGARLEGCGINLPAITAPVDRANFIYQCARGGFSLPWSTGDWVHNNAAVWPGTCFSPLVTLYAGDDTLAITYFDTTLDRRQLGWASGSGYDSAGNVATGCAPYILFFPQLDPGRSVTYTIEYRLMSGGPATHRAYYRNYIFSPFMRVLGFPEAAPTVQGPAFSDDWTEPADLNKKLAKAARLGAKTYWMWASGDNSSNQYDPDATDFSWFSALHRAAGIPTLGDLINPFISNPFNANAITTDGHRQYNGRLNIAHPMTRERIARLATALADKGVNVAFWDCGQGPDNCSTYDWLNTIGLFMQHGIPVACEQSCDLAAWVTGLAFMYPYRTDVDFSMIAGVTPKAVILGKVGEGTEKDADAHAAAHGAILIPDIDEVADISQDAA